MTTTVRVDVAVPDGGETESQFAFDAADHVRVPPPEFESANCCAGGTVPPVVYAKLARVLESAIKGGCPRTVRWTEIICGLFEAPVAVTVIAPVYGPGVKAVVFTEIVSVAGVVPDWEPGMSQPAFEAADHESVVAVELEIETDWEAGGDPPIV